MLRARKPTDRSRKSRSVKSPPVSPPLGGPPLKSPSSRASRRRGHQNKTPYCVQSTRNHTKPRYHTLQLRHTSAGPHYMRQSLRHTITITCPSGWQSDCSPQLPGKHEKARLCGGVWVSYVCVGVCVGGGGRRRFNLGLCNGALPHMEILKHADAHWHVSLVAT